MIAFTRLGADYHTLGDSFYTWKVQNDNYLSPMAGGGN
jgi:hypothetical protein